MAQNPFGTITDEQRLVALRARDDEFTVDVTDPLRTADVPMEGHFAWVLREAGDVPRLALAPIDDPEAAGDQFTRSLESTGDGRTIDVPVPLVEEGLELDPDAYDDENPLLFEPDEITDGVAVGMDEEGDPGGAMPTGIELRPVRYADGTPYSDEPLSTATLDSDPVAEAAMARDDDAGATPRAETISAPVDADHVESVLESTDASRAAVVAALETMARQDLVTEADDDTPADPLVADDRVVIGLDEDSWTENVATELAADEATLAALREVHERQAQELLSIADAEAELYQSRIPVVIQPSRKDESDAPPD